MKASSKHNHIKELVLVIDQILVKHGDSFSEHERSCLHEAKTRLEHCAADHPSPWSNGVYITVFKTVADLIIKAFWDG